MKFFQLLLISIVINNPNNNMLTVSKVNRINSQKRRKRSLV